MQKTAKDEDGHQGIDKAARFQRLAERRVNEALEKLRLVANLSNKRNYVYTEEHAQLIVDVLEAGFRQLKSRFHDEVEIQEIKFSFKDE